MGEWSTLELKKIVTHVRQYLHVRMHSAAYRHRTKRCSAAHENAPKRSIFVGKIKIFWEGVQSLPTFTPWCLRRFDVSYSEIKSYPYKHHQSHCMVVIIFLQHSREWKYISASFIPSTCRQRSEIRSCWHMSLSNSAVPRRKPISTKLNRRYTHVTSVDFRVAKNKLSVQMVVCGFWSIL